MLACAGLSVSQTGKLKEMSGQWIISEQAKNGRRRDQRTCKHLFKNLNPQSPHTSWKTVSQKYVDCGRRAWWVLLAYVKICLTPSAVVNIFYHWVDVLINTSVLNSHWLNSVSWPVGSLLKFRDIPDWWQILRVHNNSSHVYNNSMY